MVDYWTTVRIEQKVTYTEADIFWNKNFYLLEKNLNFLLSAITHQFEGNQEWIFISIQDAEYDIIAFEYLMPSYVRRTSDSGIPKVPPKIAVNYSAYLKQHISDAIPK